MKKVYGHQAAIMKVWGMVGKLLRNISPGKIENRDAEYYKQALDLSPGYSDSCNIANMDIQCKVEDASDLQSGGGTAEARISIIISITISMNYTSSNRNSLSTPIIIYVMYFRIIKILDILTANTTF